MAVKKTIRFQDLDEQWVEQDWYFSLGKTDVLDMDFIHNKDVAEYLTKIMKDKNSRELLKVWKDLLFRAVGKRIGNQLVKNDEILAEFRQGGAYEQFFSELIESDDAGASFFVAIMPSDIQEKVAKEQAKVWSKEELLAMSDGDFYQAVGTRDITAMSKEHMQIAWQRKNSEAA